MKSLATLIKLQKILVDEQRVHLNHLQDRADAVETQIAQVEIQKAREQAAAKDREANATYGAFARTMVLRGRELERERQTALMAVKIAQNKLAELFEEQKRYEIAEASRIELELKVERRRETLELDEMGSVIHERKKTDP